MSMPPEWFETSSAPPEAGIESGPRTSARKYRLISGPTRHVMLRVNSASHSAISARSSAIVTAYDTL
ncbi:Uncharacterised protein [Mycolicibacterium vanbaalenii]|uniref:Uncharacterized protein n=1 Tax=Mycolicibacterium vanbaalenii TaxID=110539 RepID=A0A5S9QJZ4_MYCVN|nr:Uncharacterised protein [Mycolicibacterium vanbaalenii]